MRSITFGLCIGLIAGVFVATCLGPRKSERLREKTPEEPEDIVDLGSELSFPASDPPAY